MFPFKVCCIQDISEADKAIAAGAIAVGLVGAMPNGPGPIPDELIREISAHVYDRWGDEVWITLLTSRTDGSAIADHIAFTGVNTVQIVDAPDAGAYLTIRKAHPNVRVKQVIHVEDADAIEKARACAEYVDAILLDSGKPSSSEPTFGGTGDVHDWSVSARIVEAVKRPVFLAGGLRPENVVTAIKQVRPYGVDVCSGLRANTEHTRRPLMPEKVDAFVGALKTL